MNEILSQIFTTDNSYSYVHFTCFNLLLIIYTFIYSHSVDEIDEWQTQCIGKKKIKQIKYRLPGKFPEQDSECS